MRKVQTSLWLDKDVKLLIDQKDLNLSDFVNRIVPKYLGVSNVDELDGRIKELRSELQVLEKKRTDLVVEQKISETGKMLDNAVLEDLKKWYVYRRNENVPETADEAWIRGAANLERCELLGKEPKQLLMELKEWYDGIQKDQL